jgi:hypothetical protein
MAVTVTNILAGPGTLYSGAFAGAEPADSAVATPPASAVWTDVGGTQDGVKLSTKQTYFELEVDQVVDVPGRRLSKREMFIETNLAEVTLDNIILSLNGGTKTASASFATYDPDAANAGAVPTYKAFIFDGWAPGLLPFNRRFIVRRVLSVEGFESEYKKDGQTLLPVRFAAHYVSASTRPFRIIDQTA